MMRPRIAWFTGLSGAGKTTIAELAATQLAGRGVRVQILDGDTVRASAHRHLGFSPADIRENNRLMALRCLDAITASDVVLVPIISPFRDARAMVRQMLGESFAEVHVNASLAEVARRDPKGLYRRAKAGELPGLIGLAADLPYEAPEHADLVLETERFDCDACARQLVDFLLRHSDPVYP